MSILAPPTVVFPTSWAYHSVKGFCSMSHWPRFLARLCLLGRPPVDIIPPKKRVWPPTLLRKPRDKSPPKSSSRQIKEGKIHQKMGTIKGENPCFKELLGRIPGKEEISPRTLDSPLKPKLSDQDVIEGNPGQNERSILRRRIPKEGQSATNL